MSDDDGVNVDTGLLDRKDKPVSIEGHHNLLVQAGANASVNVHKHFHITLTADIVPDIKSAISDEIRNQALRAILSPPTPETVDEATALPATISDVANLHQDFHNTMSGLLTELAELHAKSNILLKRICNVFASHGAIPTDVQTGSVVFKLKIVSRNRLRQFWKAYKDGTLQLALQDLLVTKDMEEKAGCSLFVELKMEDEDYNHGLSFFGQQELRLVLVGRTGTGKSTTGNHILLKDIKGHRPFATSVGGTGKTEECSYSSNEVLGRGVVVVDTPGLFDASRKNIDVLTQLTRFLLYTQPGPHAIIMVMRAGRMTPEFQQTAELLVKLFKEDVYGHMIVLFTGKDDLDEGEMLFEEYLETLPQNIREFVNKCGDRCLAFNNRASNDENLKQVNELLDMIESMKESNDGHCFESDLQKELGFLVPNEELTSDPETFRESVKKEEQVKGGWFWKALSAVATVLGWVV